MKTSKLVLFTVLLLAAGAALAGNSKTKLFKWVDKDGVTHYGSSIPPEYASQANEQLNSQGMVVKTQEAQKTPEQLAAEAQAKAQADQEAKAAAAQKAHDRVLLDTYTSVADMEHDRDSKLASIDAQINVLNGSIGSVQNNLADFQERAQELAQKNKPVPPDLQKNIESSRQQLLLNQQQLLQQQQYKQQMTEQFKADIARYKELTSPPPAGN